MPKDNDLKRKYKFCIKLNKKELDLLNKFCDKYNITNKSQFIRQTLMKSIIDRMVEKDYPSLFSDLDTGDTTTTETGGTQDSEKTETTVTTTNKDENIDHPRLF